MVVVDSQVEPAADPHVGGLVVVEVARPGTHARAASAIGIIVKPRSSSSSVRASAEGEGPDRRTPQRGEVATDAERGAEVAGDRADVGAARAVHRDLDVEHVVRDATSCIDQSWIVTRRAGSSTSSPARTRA